MGAGLVDEREHVTTVFRQGAVVVILQTSDDPFAPGVVGALFERRDAALPGKCTVVVWLRNPGEESYLWRAQRDGDVDQTLAMRNLVGQLFGGPCKVVGNVQTR